MKILFTTQLLVVAVALSSTVAFTTEAQASDKITFECVPYNSSDWATVARRGNGKLTKPIIIWHTTHFAPEFTPKNRCDIVNARLAKLAADNNNRLFDIRMKTGSVNGSLVICAITKSQPTPFCNYDNHLMNLPRGSDPKQQLENLFAQIDQPYEAGTPLQNSAPDYQIDFGNAVEKLLETAKSQSQGDGSNVNPREENNSSGGGSL